MRENKSRILAVLMATAMTVAASASLAGPSIAVDVETGRVLSQQDAFQRWYPASLTKLMTAYVAFRAVEAGQMKLDSPVTMSQTSAKEPPSKMYYKPGQSLTLDNALKIIMVKSANDVAAAIGETIGGSKAGFAKMMNAEAQRLGMTGTHFDNAHGLHSTNNYSTAHDLALLAVQLRREFPQYAGYFGTEAITTGKSIQANYNILLGRFAGADGMKTGFVCASGFNLIGSATRDGRTVVAVVLGADKQETRAAQAAELITNGFQTSGSDAPTLASLRSPGTPGLDVAPDLREKICSEQAAADRWDGREVEGRMKIASPYITPMGREPHAVKVGLIQPPFKPLIDISRVPIPAVRPTMASTQNAIVVTPGSKPTAIQNIN